VGTAPSRPTPPVVVPGPDPGPRTADSRTGQPHIHARFTTDTDARAQASPASKTMTSPSRGQRLPIDPDRTQCALGTRLGTKLKTAARSARGSGSCRRTGTGARGCVARPESLSQERLALHVATLLSGAPAEQTRDQMWRTFGDAVPALLITKPAALP
jgi:hypothetical protein